MVGLTDDNTIVMHWLQSSLMKGSNDGSISSCGRSDGSDIASITSSLVSLSRLNHLKC